MQEPEKLEVLKRRARELTAPDHFGLGAEIQTLPPHDIAGILESLENELRLPVLLEQDPKLAGQVLVELNEEVQGELVPQIPLDPLAKILTQLQPDDAADIYAFVEDSNRAPILRRLPQDLRHQILHLASYHQESAGGIMTPEFLAVPESTTLAETLEQVSHFEELETDQVYVVDSDQRLSGVIRLQEILAEDDQSQPVSAIMDRQVASVRDTDDQEQALRQATHYGLNTVPVLNEGGHLVGIVTTDDLDQVQEEEVSEDLLRMAGTLARNPTRLPTLTRILYRLPQLVVTTTTCLIIALIIELLVPPEGQVDMKLEALKYLPLIIALSGNVGTIVNVLVVRGLATQEMEVGNLFHHFLEEFRVGVGIGLLSSTLTFIVVGFLENWNHLAFAVAFALLLAPIISGLAGFLIPVTVNRLGRDPAISGPLVTNINDLAGTTVYVLTCLLMLH